MKDLIEERSSVSTQLKQKAEEKHEKKFKHELFSVFLFATAYLLLPCNYLRTNCEDLSWIGYGGVKYSRH